MQSVRVDVHRRIRLGHALKIQTVPFDARLLEHPVMSVRRRRVTLRRPSDEPHGFGASAQLFDVGPVEAHLVMAPEHDTELAQRLLNMDTSDGSIRRRIRLGYSSVNTVY